MHPFDPTTESLTIRMAVPADAEALRRLAQLDSAPTPGPAPMLIAEIAGELRVAVPLYGGRPLADPFHLTAELVALLSERARQIARTSCGYDRQTTDVARHPSARQAASRA